MNENQENNGFGEEANESEPFVKKVAKFSAFIYLGLAILVVVVATVGIFSISYDYEQSMPSVSFPEMGYTNDEISVPQIVITPNQNQSSTHISDTPVAGEESGVTDELNDPQAPKPTLFYRPVVGEVKKSYSMDKLVFSETMGDYRVHSGIDIECDLGTSVVCFADGIVASIENDYFYGTRVSVTHDGGVVSHYMNLDPTLAENISVGSEVKAGQSIGTVGATARIEANDPPHLHFEMTVNGNLVNPESELP